MYFPPVVSVPNIDDGAFINRDILPRISIKTHFPKSTSIVIDGAPSTTPTMISTEGIHTVEVTAEDQKGARVSLKRTFTIDKTPPVTSLKASPSVLSESSLVFVTGKAVLEVAAIDKGATPSGIAVTECQIDGGAWQPYRDPIRLQEFKEGTHTLICRSTDNAGNMEEERKLPLSLSNTPPTTVLTLSAPHRNLRDGSFMASPATIFSLFASGSRAGVSTTEYQVDDGPWQAAAPFSILNEGKHVIRFKSIDRLGNEEAPKSAAVIIDKNPPMTKLKMSGSTHTGSNKLLHASPSTVFSLVSANSAIAVSKTEYRIDNREWLHYEPFSVTEEGRHLIEYRSIDEVGNVEQTRQETVVIDAAPPVTVLSLDGKKIDPASVIYTKGSNTLTFTADDFLSGVKNTEFRIDGGKWQQSASTELKTTTSHQVNYRSTDNVGNEEEIRTVTVKLDTTPPVSTLEVSGTSTLVKDILHITEKTVLIVRSTDALSGVAKTECRIDDGGWKLAEPFSLETPGEHLVEIRSSDAVGNEEKARLYKVVTDITAPVTIAIPKGKKGANSGTVYTTSTAPFTLSVHSPAWGVKSTEYRIDGGGWTDYTKPFAIGDEGKHSLEFKSIDKAGNEESMRAMEVIVDDTAPVSSVSVGTPSKEVEGSIEIEPGTLLTPTASDNLSGVARIEYQITGQAVEKDGVPFSIASKGTYEISHWSIDRAGNREKPRKIKVVVSNTPKRFTPEDIKISTEVSTPPEEKKEQVAQQVIEKKEEPAPPPLPEPPPDPEPPPRPPIEKKNPLMKWTVNFLQAILIIGVMLF